MSIAPTATAPERVEPQIQVFQATKTMISYTRRRLVSAMVLSGLPLVPGFSFTDLFYGNSKRSLALAAKLACSEVRKTRLQSHAGDSEIVRDLPLHG